MGGWVWVCGCVGVWHAYMMSNNSFNWSIHIFNKSLRKDPIISSQLLSDCYIPSGFVVDCVYCNLLLASV